MRGCDDVLELLPGGVVIVGATVDRKSPAVVIVVTEKTLDLARLRKNRCIVSHGLPSHFSRTQ